MERWTPVGGTPQGAVISPLLANIYLHCLDRQMKQKGYRMVRYADDFVVLCRTAEEARAALNEVRAWVEQNGLSLMPARPTSEIVCKRGKVLSFSAIASKSGGDGSDGKVCWRCESGYGRRLGARVGTVWPVS